ncbi:hypothetical protein EK21DRAFT_57232 [Setomelanomma holmii]|uniref:Uncharacterized protein n=1 Tax=Setomelanomma holmii TaxID=210430 RepID=A0A9P4LQC9_9PLEO|nr:hypothetical protein EK21DRAFT_57232 [Setomelanomma holmii]
MSPSFRPTDGPQTAHPTPSEFSKQQILHSPSKSIYDEILRHHYAYDQQHGYSTRVLTTPLVRGAGWMLHWLQCLMIGEMMKDVESMAEWILYFAPSTILSTNHANIDMEGFLPPISASYETLKTLSVIGMKTDEINLSSSLLFLRVSMQTLRVLSFALAEFYTAPEPARDSETNASIDLVGQALHFFLEQNAYRDTALYQPLAWYESAFLRHKGASEVEHVLYLQDTLETLSSAPQDRVGDEECDTKPFWDAVIEGKQVLNEAKDRGHDVNKGEWSEEVLALKNTVELKAWDVKVVREGIRVLKERPGLGDIVVWEAAY